MAELTDDFGSDAEEYEDALDELIADEKALPSASKDDNDSKNEDDKIESISKEVENEEEKPSATSFHNDNIKSDIAEDADKEVANDIEQDDEDDSTSSSEEEEGNDVNNKAYRDIPADPSEESCQENQHDALHDRLNEDLEKDEDEEEEEEEEKIKDIYFVDEEAMKELEENMTDEDKLAKKDASQVIKAEGNEQYKAADYMAALTTYTEALRMCPLCFHKERSIMYSNRGACHFKRELYDKCIGDCTLAINIHPHYVKAIQRRAECYEKTDKLEEALQDYQKLLEIDPSIMVARAACMRLPDQIKEKNEKLKEEMMGKLKDLGNMVLKPFGLSTNNFNFVQDPNTGSYSVNFNNNGN